ncbi:hypothetical protein [Paracraurococcus lichenis]|uniref:Uncharacterized protein n=1 Tax=Paracraurococcus lichenis TaxID=3064888 RepID=A0ABT9E9N1_9PROT|nr:hypothetical protein [Paracraurococcus sp. LOR1-02]MDO9712899.1 hypothetical protein [Paracraurococcus sp. LOR1-02]
MANIDIKLSSELMQRLSLPSCASFSLGKPELPSITLPTGGTIKALADVTKGVPTDCSLNFNLMLQITPLLASMECLFEVLKLVGALKKFFEAAAKGFVEVPAAAVELLNAFEGVAKCITFPFGTGAFLFVRDLLKMIGSILRCIGQGLKSTAALMGGLTVQIQAAQDAGNTELMEALGCARDNALASAQGSLLAIEPITLVLGMAEPFLGIAGVSPVKLPAVGGADNAEALDALADGLLGTSQVLLTLAEGIKVPGG